MNKNKFMIIHAFKSNKNIKKLHSQAQLIKYYRSNLIFKKMSRRSGSSSQYRPTSYQSYKPSYQPVHPSRSVNYKPYYTTKKSN